MIGAIPDVKEMAIMSSFRGNIISLLMISSNIGLRIENWGIWKYNKKIDRVVVCQIMSVLRISLF
jgi:hypothetical protein